MTADDIAQAIDFYLNKWDLNIEKEDITPKSYYLLSEQVGFKRCSDAGSDIYELSFYLNKWDLNLSISLLNRWPFYFYLNKWDLNDFDC